MRCSAVVSLALLSSLAGLAQALDPPVDPVAPLTLSDRLALFDDKTITQVQPYVATVVSASFLQLVSSNRLWGQGADKFTNHLVASFSRRLATYGIQSAAAAALQEDLRYKPSLSNNVWRRTGHALFTTLVLETPQGNQIAWANIVAALGSGVIIDTYHPGREYGHSGALNLVGLNFLGFAKTNLWLEFKPDVKYFVRHRILPFPHHRLVVGNPAEGEGGTDAVR
jgi:hypothetical protein